MGEDKRLLTEEEHNALLRMKLLEREVALIRVEIAEMRKELQGSTWSKVGYTVLGGVITAITIKLVFVAGTVP